MSLGALQETITVSGDSPMIEVSKPSNVLNIDADFQKQVPVVGGFPISAAFSTSPMFFISGSGAAVTALGQYAQVAAAGSSVT